MYLDIGKRMMTIRLLEKKNRVLLVS